MTVAKLCRFVPLLLLVSVAACGDSDPVKRPDGGRDGGFDGGDEDGGPGEDAGDDGAVTECPEVSFVTPSSGTLTEADDKDKDRCANGFQYDVTVATTAADGTSATLYAGGGVLAKAAAKGALIVFEDIQMSSNVETTLRVQVDGVDCVATTPISVKCAVPTCEITKPVVSPAHPLLNGVPVANGGDRVSNGGSAYQVAVEVTTSIEEDQPVQLTIDGSPVRLTALAKGGKATFPGVTLTPDGDHELVATCTAKTGAIGTSARATYSVDSAAPELTIASPANDAHFEQVPSFEVCATSTSPDARDLSSELGAANLCGAVGAATPVCAALASASVNGGTVGRGCVQIPCPGGPAFDVNVSLRDRAGNSTSKVLTGITCRTDLPGIEIVSPSATLSGDPSTRILAPSATQTRKDADPATPGAQYTVVACTDLQNAPVQLQVGLAGGTVANLGTPVASQAATVGDGCPAGKQYVAKFVSVTLPESGEDALGQLSSATRLVAVVTDPSSTKGTSLPVDVWVDSQPPTLSAAVPAPLCGHFRQSATDATIELRMNTSVLPLTLTITHPDATQQTLTGTSHLVGLQTNLGNALFQVGVNTVAATVAEPSGNVASLPSPCEVTVGNPPIVTWTAPTSSSKLNASNDGDPSTAGWQGSLTVHTDLGAVVPIPTVQFSTASGGNLGAPVAVDSNGDATLTGITVPEGAAVQLVATTSDVAARGVGRATITIPVDTVVPAGISDLAVSVPEETRRQSAFRLAWTAPAHNGEPVEGYEVRVSTSPITDSTTFNAAERVVYTGMPAQPGQPDSMLISNRYIERDYYFALMPVDVGGNLGPIASVGPARAAFKRTVLTLAGSTIEAFGRSVDGSTSVNGDAFADLIVGAAKGSAAYIYLGSADGLASTPALTITGPAGVSFGYTAQFIGDIDSDGFAELAVTAPFEGPGTVYIYKGRANWVPPSPPPLTAANADYRVVAETADARFTGTVLGVALVRLGDFDGDGVDDFAVGGHRYGTNRGYVAVVRGVPAGQTFPATVTLGVGSSQTIEMEAPTAGLDARFGFELANFGPFYGGTTNVLGVGADGYAGPGKRYGAAFAFASGALDANNPTDAVIGTQFEAFMGWSIAPLGALGSPMAVAVNSPFYTSQGTAGVAIHIGSTSTGPFVTNPIVLTTAAPNNPHGDCVFGSVLPPIPASSADNKSSFLGNTLPDVAMSGLATSGGVPQLYLIDGQKVPSLMSGAVASIADGQVAMPDDWAGAFTCMPRSGAIRDLNNDGYADLAVGQYKRTGDYAGQVLVLW